jgi:hypothetical protein
VGNRAQACEYDSKLPVALRQVDRRAVSIGHITTPTVSSSMIPSLLGFTSLRKNRAIIDFNTLKLYFCGPGDYELGTGLPPGTDRFQCELAPLGHLVHPCCEYEASTASSDHTLTLVTETQRGITRSQQAEARPAASTRSASLPVQPSSRRIPPPPLAPPNLPANWPQQTPYEPPSFQGM